MKSKNPVTAAEQHMLAAQSHYARALNQEAYIRMLRCQVEYYRLLAQQRGEPVPCVESM